MADHGRALLRESADRWTHHDRRPGLAAEADPGMQSLLRGKFSRETVLASRGRPWRVPARPDPRAHDQCAAPLRPRVGRRSPSSSSSALRHGKRWTKTAAEDEAKPRVGDLLWEETSRKIRPSHARSLFGRRAFASSFANARQVARTCSMTPWPVKAATTALGDRLSEFCCSTATVRTSKPFCSLANAGTILLSGPRGAMASFGSPEGHSLLVGTSDRRAGRCASSMRPMDALLRLRLVSRVLRDRSAWTFRTSPSHSWRQAMASMSCSARTPPSSSTSPT
jgi:hypothetical protein